MAEQLVYIIKNNEEEYCTVYKHWSGYFSTAIEEVLQLMGNYENVLKTACKTSNGTIEKSELSDMQVTLAIANHLINNNDVIIKGKGGIDKEDGNLEEYKRLCEKENIKDEHKMGPTECRNAGIVSLTPRSMGISQSCACHIVDIDLSDREYPEFVMGYPFKVSEDELEELKEEGIELPKVDFDFNDLLQFHLPDYENIKAKYEQVVEKQDYTSRFVDSGNEPWQL